MVSRPVGRTHIIVDTRYSWPRRYHGDCLGNWYDIVDLKVTCQPAWPESSREAENPCLRFEISRPLENQAASLWLVPRHRQYRPTTCWINGYTPFRQKAVRKKCTTEAKRSAWSLILANDCTATWNRWRINFITSQSVARPSFDF